MAYKNQYDKPPAKRKRGRPPKQKIEVDILGPDGKPTGSTMMTTKVSPQAALVETEPPVPKGEVSQVPNLVSACVQIRESVNLEDPQTLWSAMDKYLSLCAMSGMKISNSFLYLACGVTKQTIGDWKFGRTRQNNPEYRKFAETCQQICSAAREQYGLEGEVNPILTIFHQKFYDGFTDTPKVEGAKDPLGEIQDPAKLAEKYKDIIVD